MSRLDELKKRIESNKKKLDLSSFDQYINYYNLKKGLDKVPTHVLYYAYSTFIKRFEEDLPLNTVTFYKRLKKSFKSVRWGNQRYYLLDRQSIQNIDENLEFRANLWKRTKNKKK